MALVDFDGILISCWIPAETFRAALSYIPKVGDVFVASHPKCGTTWMQYIVHEILNNCCEPPLVHEMRRVYGPHIEHVPFEKAHSSDGFKRHLQTHLPFNYLQYNEKAKYIHISRNPWDACVSAYNYKVQFPGEVKFEGTFDDYFNNFINGHTDYGSYFDHTVSWLGQKGKENILFLTYEETKQDTKATVLKVAKFLGDQYFTELNENEKKMAKLLNYVSFDYMKKLPMMVPKVKNVRKKVADFEKNLSTTESGDYVNIKMFNEGKVGYTKQWYSDQQQDRMKQKIQKHFCKFDDLLALWKQFNVEV